MSKLSKRIGIGSTLACLALLAPNAGHATVEFGKEGQPVHLVVGYQPYYTQAWSGVVMNGTRLWEKYLPKGSTVEFQVGLQGAIIVNAMTGEKLHIGYAGDMPSIAATFRYLKERGGVDIRIVAVLGTSKQQCNVFMVRNDAPQFKSGREAVKWMDGKVTSSPLAARRAMPSVTSLDAVGSQITAASSLPARKLVVMTSMFWLR